MDQSHKPIRSQVEKQKQDAILKKSGSAPHSLVSAAFNVQMPTGKKKTLMICDPGTAVLINVQVTYDEPDGAESFAAGKAIDYHL